MSRAFTMDTEYGRSIVWNLYTIDEADATKAICKLCKAPLSRGGKDCRSFNTSNLKKHLISKHKDAYTNEIEKVANDKEENEQMDQKQKVGQIKEEKFLESITIKEEECLFQDDEFNTRCSFSSNGSGGAAVHSLALTMGDEAANTFSAQTGNGDQYTDDLSNFRNVKESNWSKSVLITCDKFFRIAKCDERMRLSCLCLMCPNQPGVYISADPSSCGNLKTHISRRHPTMLAEFDTIRKSRSKKRQLTSASPAPKRLAHSTHSVTRETRITQSEFNKKITAFIVDGMYPLSLVENRKFRNLLTGVHPELVVPSRRSLSRHMSKLAANVHVTLKEKLAKQSYLCTTADIWSTKHRSFIGVTVHWINSSTLERGSGMLGCIRFRGDHTFQKITEILNDVRRKFNISENKIIATVTDNGANFVKAFKDCGILLVSPLECTEEEHEGEAAAAEGTDDAPSDEESLFMNSHVVNVLEEEVVLPCSSHTLTLVSTTDAMGAMKDPSYSKLHQSAMGKCSTLWNMATRPKSSEVISDVLGCPLTVPCITRWNSLYDSLSVLIKHEIQLNELMLVLSLPIFEDVEFEFIEEYVSVMGPIATALDRLQSDKECFYGCVLPTLLAVEKRLKRLDSSHPRLRHCQPLLDAVIAGFTERFRIFLTLDTSAGKDCIAAILASVSNPYFKLKWLTIKQELNTNSTKEMVQGLLVNAAKTLGASESADRFIDDVASDAFFEYESELPTILTNHDTTEMEILKYLGDSNSCMSSLKEYPSISRVFLRYNTPLSSSAPVERLFSLAGRLYSPKDNKLSDKMFSQLLFLKGNGH